MSKAKGLPGKALKAPKPKKIPGKSITKDGPVPSANYKPTLWLDGNQLTGDLKGAQYGDTVNMTVQAKVTRTAQGSEGKSVTLELQKLAVSPPAQKK